MSRRRKRENTGTRDQAVALLAAHARDALDDTSVSIRDDLLAVADYWPDVAARRVAGSGRALTGMPAGAGDVHRLPLDLGAASLTEDVNALFRRLVLALAELNVHLAARTPSGRLRQAAYEAWRLGERERLDLAETASDLRSRCESMLGAKVRTDWLGPCPTASCVADVRLPPGRSHRTCPGCGADVTRTSQELYIRECLEGRLMTLSELTSALVVCGMPTPYDTIRSWARFGRLTEHLEDWAWLGVPYVVPRSGLYPFQAALDLALARFHRGLRAA